MNSLAGMINSFSFRALSFSFNELTCSWIMSKALAFSAIRCSFSIASRSLSAAVSFKALSIVRWYLQYSSLARHCWRINSSFCGRKPCKTDRNPCDFGLFWRLGGSIKVNVVIY